jgi:Ca-activated chloride channel homolog
MLIPRMKFSARADCELVDAGTRSERYIEWAIRAPEAPLAASRPPLNLALVIDRSGSMGGAKLSYAKQAAQYVLDRLEARDRAALVAYDGQVRVLARSAHMTAAHRQALGAEIARLGPGGSTNLGEGWLQGAGQVAEHILPDGVNRALLLTDGLANVGMTSTEELAGHARELRQRGVSTSTFGVGEHFNEHLLEAMAEQGGGNYHFIEHPGDIPAVFERELGELLTVVARDANLVVSGPDTAAVELLGGLAYDYDGHSLRIPLGSLFGGQSRLIYLRAITLPGQAGTTLPIAGRLSWVDLSGDRQTNTAEVIFRYASAAEVEQALHDTELRARAAAISLEQAATEALRQDRNGMRRQAVETVEAALAAYGRFAAPAAAAEVRQLAHRLQEDSMSLLEKKRRHAQAYTSRKSR